MKNEIVDLLLSSGSFIDALDKFGKPPIYYASRRLGVSKHSMTILKVNYLPFLYIIIKDYNLLSLHLK